MIKSKRDKYNAVGTLSFLGTGNVITTKLEVQEVCLTISDNRRLKLIFCANLRRVCWFSTSCPTSSSIIFKNASLKGWIREMLTLDELPKNRFSFDTQPKIIERNRYGNAKKITQPIWWKIQANSWRFLSSILCDFSIASILVQYIFPIKSYKKEDLFTEKLSQVFKNGEKKD